jgi:glycosidase
MKWRLTAIAVLAVAACKSPDPIARPDADDSVDGGLADVAAVDADAEAAADVVKDVAADEHPEPDPAGNDDGPAGDDEEPGQDVQPDEATAGDVAWIPVPRTCEVAVTFKPPVAAQSVGVCGPWNQWGQVGADPNAKRECDAMTGPAGDGTFSITYGAGQPAAPGEYAYKLCVDGCANGQGWHMDPGNPLVIYDGPEKVENSKLVVPDCDMPLIVLDSAQADWAKKSIRVVARLYTGVDGSAIDPSSVRAELRGEPLDDPGFDPATQTFTVEREGLAPGKHTLVFHASNAHGDAAPLFVPLWLEEKPFAWSDAVLYFAMTDRFHDGDTKNDVEPACPDDGTGKSNWMGGDFEGIRLKIEEGYFDGLGVSAIWISPANLNPPGCSGGDLGRQYASYHGYHMVALDQTDPHFGSFDDLRKMVTAAHGHGIRVLMDLTANHVHESSSLWAQHKDWFNQTPLVCGDDDNWNKHPLDCWFQSYLPDLDFRSNDAVNAFTDAAVEWVLRADLDGFRVDAVKHMWHSFGRTLRFKLKQRVETTGVPCYLVGETYSGDWGGGTGTEETMVKAYVSDVELHGQFDFPLYWAVLDAFGRNAGDLGGLYDVLAGSIAFYGPGAIMSRFLGNHDVPRFISHAAGVIADRFGNGAKEQGWSNPPALPQSAAPFENLKMAFAFLMTVPGVPLIYYGDEIGMPGAGDPDNRRMMTFDGLTANQVALKAAVSTLAKTRAAHPATRAGALAKLWGDKDGLAYAAVQGGDAVVAVFNRAAARTVSVPLQGLSGLPSSGDLTDVLTGSKHAVTGGALSLDLPQNGVMVLVP